jgi:hypothetical protein
MTATKVRWELLVSSRGRAAMRLHPPQDNLETPMEAEVDEHGMNGEDDEIALMTEQFQRYRQQVRRQPGKALAVAFGAGAVAMGVAVVFVTAIWKLAAVH